MPQQTWIFQGTPDRFDIEGYLRAGLDRITWRASRMSHRMGLGDTVYIWQAAGKRKARSGILAHTTIVSEPWVGPDHDEALPFQRGDGAPAEEGQRVWLRVERIVNSKELLARTWLADDPICHDLLILRQRQATNYLLEPHQAERIAAMWSRIGISWTRSESVAALWVYHKTCGHRLSKLIGSPVSDLSVLSGRSISSVYNKVLNFSAIDPRDEQAGLKDVGQTDRDVWDEFYDIETATLRVDKLETEYMRQWGDKWDVPPDIETYWEQLEQQTSDLTGCSVDELLRRYKEEGHGNPKPRKAKTRATVYQRNHLVIKLARQRAGYRCEIPDCEWEPFLQDSGVPFIEVHHIHTLAEGGPDTLDNVACLCPNHHRELHHGEKAENLRVVLLKLRSRSA